MKNLITNFMFKILIALIIAVRTFGAIMLDNVSSTTSSNQSSISFSHTTGSGQNRLLLVSVSVKENVSVNSVSYNANSLIRAGFANNSGQARAEIWYLIAPQSGTSTVMVNISGNSDIIIGAATFTGVDQTNPLGTFVSSTGSSGTTASVDASSASGEIVFDAVAWRDVSSLSVGAGQTQHWNPSTFSNFRGGSSTESGASSVTMSWTTTVSGKPWAICAVPIKSYTALKTWTGNVSSDWFEAANWSPVGIPSSDTIIVPTSPVGGRYPVYSKDTLVWIRGLEIKSGASFTQTTGDLMTVGSITIENGATYYQQNGDLTIYYDWINRGTFTSDNGYVVVGDGSAASDFASGNNEFCDFGVSTLGKPKFDNYPNSQIIIKRGFYNYGNYSVSPNVTFLFTSSNTALIYVDNTAGNASLGNFIIDKPSGVVILKYKTVEISGDFILKNGTFDIDTCTFKGNSTGKTFALENGSILKIGGTKSFPAGFSTINLSSASTVEYSGSNQTVLNLNYGNLTLSGSGTKMFSSGITGIAGTIAINGSTSAQTIGVNSTIDYNFDGDQIVKAMSYNNLTLSGSGKKTFQNGATMIYTNFSINGGASADARTFSSIISYNGITNQVIQPLDYHRLTLTSSGVKIFPADTTRISELLVINAAASGDAITNSSTIEFDGSGIQTIKSMNYYNLILSGSGSKVFSTGTTGIAGNFTVNGNLTPLAGVNNLNSNYLPSGENSFANGNWALGNISINTLTNNSNIDYNGAGDQDVLAIDYYDLTLSNSGTKYFAAGTVGIGNILNIKDTAIPNAVTKGDTIKYFGPDQEVRYGFINKNLRLTSQTSLTAMTNLNVSNTLLIENNSSLNMNNYVLTVDGKLINDGTYISTNPAGSMSFYSKNSGDLNSLDTWSNNNYDGPSAVRLPGEINNDALIIGQNKTITLTSNINNFGTVRVDSSGTLNPVNFALGGIGKFDLRAGGNLIIGSAYGLDASSGNIQTEIQSFNSSSNYQFKSSVPQVTGTAFPSAANSLLISNPNGVELSNSVRLSGDLNLNEGNLILGEKDLTLSAASQIGGTPSDSNMIIASSSGQLIKEFSETGSFTFPVGDNIGTAEYSPVTLSFTSGSFTSAFAGVNVVNEKHPQNASAINYINRYWTIRSSGITNFSCDASFTYTDADLQSSSDESKIFAGHYDGVKWTVLNPGNISLNQLTGTVTSFSDFTGGEYDALPVELVSFNASVNDNSVNLSWQTATELNNFGFEVERAFASASSVQTWENIGFVKGAGNSSSPKEYSFKDLKLANKSYQYRLKQVDNDGSFTYSKVINVTVEYAPSSFGLSQNYPNPFNPSTKISWQSPVSSWQTLKVYDILGNEVATLVDEFRAAGSYEIDFNASQLTSGVYVYKISAGEFSDTKKMLLTK